MSYIDKDGYVVLSQRPNRLEHIEVVEKALGRQLPLLAVVHHWDEDKTNNAPSNLLICPNRAYHNLIHKRMRAYAECGHADWLKCRWCCKYEPPGKLRISGTFAYHRECNNANALRVKERKRLRVAA